MALDATTSKAIANALADGTSYKFPTPYLGLLTQMPGTNGTGGKELSYPEYCRVSLTALGIEGKTILADAATEAGTGDDVDKLIAYVKNQELIYFPDVDTVEDDYSEQVVGVAMYSSKTAITPYLWGKLPEGSEVTVQKKSVPMIKLNNLKLTAK